MKRRPLLAGNWKMHLSVAEAVELAESIAKGCANVNDRDVMLAPSFTLLPAVAKTLAGSSVMLASQNVCWERQGAFTGEISPAMLHEFGVSMAIVGHSERRHIFGEDDEMVNKRLSGAMKHGLIPILCVGETLDEREKNETFTVLENQVRKGLDGVVLESGSELVVAYEPVWAIGTGKTAGPEQAQEAHHFIRNILVHIFEKKVAGAIRILYGGSVKPDNIDRLMTEPDIDGALVGGAALEASSFNRIIHFHS